MPKYGRIKKNGRILKMGIYRVTVTCSLKPHVALISRQQ